MQSNRLVKVALPSDLVVSMDTYINGTASYSGRQDFVADAIANLLADLEVGEVALAEPSRPEPRNAPALRTDTLDVSPESELAVEVDDRLETSNTPFGPRLEPPVAEALAEVVYPNDGQLRAAPVTPRPSKPTWGIHNRDFPTLWAAGMLSRELVESETVSYVSWLRDIAQLAWSMTMSLPNTDVDLSGFPLNVDKADKSEARFIRFFVGDEPGSGPLFDLALVADIGDGNVVLTQPGLDLLQSLRGWSPRRSADTVPAKRDAFLRHLACWVPADFSLMASVIEAINAGKSDRDSLVAAVGSGYPEWSTKVANTNVAGYVGRSRQWGLIDRRQHKRQYVLAPGAMEALNQAATFAHNQQGVHS